MSTIIFSVILAFNLNIASLNKHIENKFDNVGKPKVMLMYEIMGKEGVKEYRKEFWCLFIC